jgi:4'-phosphopantetheinyl transferase
MVFSPEEVDALERLPGEQVGPAFLRGWTRKEAYIKALGIGLGGADLKAITVGLEEELRIVPPIQGISSQQIAVRSLSSDGYLAIAAHPKVTQFQVRNLDASALGFLAART